MVGRRKDRVYPDSVAQGVNYQKMAEQAGMPKVQYHPDPDRLGEEQLKESERESEGDDEDEVLYNESTRGFQKIPEIDEEQFQEDKKNLNQYVKDHHLEEKMKRMNVSSIIFICIFNL